MSSTALSVSVTRSEAASSDISEMFSNEDSFPRTILFRVHCARVGRCDHIPSLQGYVEEEIMDFLEVRLGHGFLGSLVGLFGSCSGGMMSWWKH